MRSRPSRLLASTLVLASSQGCRVAPVNNALGLEPRTFTQLTAHLASRDSVRVRGTFGEVVMRRPMLTPDSLLAAPDTSGMRSPRLGLRDVTSIQVRGGASGTGAAVGAGVGLAGGLAFALGLTASLCSDGGCTNEGGATAVIALGSAGAGALLGSLIGAPLKKWHTVYRARRVP